MQSTRSAILEIRGLCDRDPRVQQRFGRSRHPCQRLDTDKILSFVSLRAVIAQTAALVDPESRIARGDLGNPM
jgi:hypothetical protein